MAKIKKEATASTPVTPKKSSLDDLASSTLNIFEGVFTAWGRKVPDKNDPKVLVDRFKCVCTRPLANGDQVDISAWITKAQADHFGIANGTTFAAKFAYEDVNEVSPKGQYNEERSLYKARLLSVLA